MEQKYPEERNKNKDMYISSEARIDVWLRKQNWNTKEPSESMKLQR
jgi:hypothetical protein